MMVLGIIFHVEKCRPSFWKQKLVHANNIKTVRSINLASSNPYICAKPSGFSKTFEAHQEVEQIRTNMNF